MKSVMTLTPKEQRGVARALTTLAGIFAPLATANGNAPRRRAPRASAGTPRTRTTPARTRSAKNPLAQVSD